MLKENIEAQCRKISPGAYSEKSVCAFAPGGASGFIDTSNARDGTRGIAFFGDRMYVNTDGVSREIAYRSIVSSHIISSFEDSFADELSVSANGAEMRISDYSLDKFELKRLLDELCRDSAAAPEEQSAQVEKYAAEIAAKLAEQARNRDAERVESAARQLKKAAETPPVIKEEPPHREPLYEGERPVIEETVVDIPTERAPLPENYSPAPIPEEKIDWLSGESVSRVLRNLDTVGKTDNAPEADEQKNETNNERDSEKAPENESAAIQRPKPPEIMNGVVDRVPVIGTIKPPKPAFDSAESYPKTPPAEEKTAESAPTETEMRERIGNMDDDEMMSFLSETLSEINDQSEPFFEQTDVPQKQYETVPAAEDSPRENTPEPPKPDVSKTQAVPEKAPSKWEHLTVEPIWGDIYIKASKDLRMLCESGKLTMEQMEAEIKERLLSTAEAFEKIIEDESRVPKVMIPKITELKAAVENFEHYFEYGEDIAIRAMFFMMYQMLSYADRMVESPETKDRLNDFFRRFGSAGITLSMLDMRV